MAKVMVIIINGTGGNGKDSFISMCRDYMKVCNVSSIDQVKNIAKKMGWDGIKDDAGRLLLHRLKKAWTEYNDGPAKYVEYMVRNIKEHTKQSTVIFLHIREPEEIKKTISMLDDFRCLTVLLTNNRVMDITSNESDKGVYNYIYDDVIDNSGSMEDLKLKAKDFCSKLKEKLQEV